MSVAIFSALAGGALSLWGDANRRSEERKARNARIKGLEKAKIDATEREIGADRIKDYYNVVGSSEANRMAFGAGSILNPDTVRGLNASNILGQRASDLAQFETDVITQNQRIDAEIAGVPEVGGIDYGEVISGGIAGIKIGTALDKLLPENVGIGDLVTGGPDISGIKPEGMEEFNGVEEGIKESNRVKPLGMSEYNGVEDIISVSGSILRVPNSNPSEIEDVIIPDINNSTNPFSLDENGTMRSRFNRFPTPSSNFENNVNMDDPSMFSIENLMFNRSINPDVGVGMDPIYENVDSGDFFHNEIKKQDKLMKIKQRNKRSSTWNGYSF